MLECSGSFAVSPEWGLERNPERQGYGGLLVGSRGLRRQKMVETRFLLLFCV